MQIYSLNFASKYELRKNARAGEGTRERGA
jgi:hypothetical protein